MVSLLAKLNDFTESQAYAKQVVVGLSTKW